MSMIGAQCDELRELAGDGSMEWVAGPIRASILRDAADTISELRDMIANLEETNGKLREQVDQMHLMRVLDQNEIERLEAENNRLRELLSGVGHLLFALDVDYCACCPRDSDAHPCPVYTIAGGECLYKRDMRELGIEVDG